MQLKKYLNVSIIIKNKKKFKSYKYHACLDNREKLLFFQNIWIVNSITNTELSGEFDLNSRLLHSGFSDLFLFFHLLFRLFGVFLVLRLFIVFFIWSIWLSRFFNILGIFFSFFFNIFFRLLFAFIFFEFKLF